MLSISHDVSIIAGYCGYVKRSVLMIDKQGRVNLSRKVLLADETKEEK